MAPVAHSTLLQNLRRLFPPRSPGESKQYPSEIETAIRAIFPAHGEAYEGEVWFDEQTNLSPNGSVQLPVDSQLVILSVAATFVTDANVANRQLAFDLFRVGGGLQYAASEMLVNIPASQTRSIYWAVGSDRQTGNISPSSYYVPLPRIVLPPGAVARFRVANNQAGDIFSSVRMLGLRRRI